MTLRHLFAAAAAAAFATACASLNLTGADGAEGADGAGAASEAYSAEILRLPYGVPRIVADDHGGLGYGAGYVAAQDNLCLVMERALTVRGERAAFFGPGEGERNVASDLYHRRMVDDRVVETLLAGAPSDIDTPSGEARAFIAGFAAGVNRVVAEGGTDDPACTGEPWVRPLSETDVWLGALTLPFGQPVEAVAFAQPPADGDATYGEARVEDLLVERRGMGSNAYAIGSDAARRRGALGAAGQSALSLGRGAAILPGGPDHSGRTERGGRRARHNALRRDRSY